MGSHARVVLLLVLTFGAGAAAGVAADRLGMLPGEPGERPARRGDQTADRGDENGRAESDQRRAGRTTIERFADDIGLSSEQRVEIDEVLERHRASVQDMWDATRPRYRSLVDSARTQIEALLTPEQVTRYRELLRSQRSGNGRRGDGASGESDRRDDAHDRSSDGSSG